MSVRNAANNAKDCLFVPLNLTVSVGNTGTERFPMMSVFVFVIIIVNTKGKKRLQVDIIGCNSDYSQKVSCHRVFSER